MDMNETSDLKPTIIKNLGQKIGYTPKIYRHLKMKNHDPINQWITLL